MEAMAEQRNGNFLNEIEEQTTNFTDEDFARFERTIKRRGRAAAPAIAVPMGAAPAQPINTSMFRRFTRP